MNHETEIINDYSSDTQATSKRGNATVKAVVISGVSALAIGGVVGALTLADVIKWHSKSEPSMKNKEDFVSCMFLMDISRQRLIRRHMGLIVRIVPR